MSIWVKTESLGKINELRKNTLNSRIGIRVTEIGEDYIKAIMPVDERTRQPLGLLYGGASVVLAESIGSLGSYLAIESDKRCVGLEINANHLGSVATGWVTGIARPLHMGRSTHVWDIRIMDDKKRLVCVARLTMAII